MTRSPIWGDHHRGFLGRYAEYHFGTPKEDWLRVVLKRSIETARKAAGWSPEFLAALIQPQTR